jgi:hypothetical protein
VDKLSGLDPESLLPTILELEKGLAEVKQKVLAACSAKWIGNRQQFDAETTRKQQIKAEYMKLKKQLGIPEGPITEVDAARLMKTELKTFRSWKKRPHLNLKPIKGPNDRQNYYLEDDLLRLWTGQQK